MKKAIAILLLLPKIALAQVTQYEAEGNLEAPDPAGCVAIDELRNTQNPADLFVGVVRCIEKEDYTSAVNLVLVAGSFGSFDTLRVADTTAHQALSVLQINTFGNLNEEQINRFTAALELFEPNSDNMRSNCKALEKLGPPAYYPRYMIQHGIRTITGEGEPLVEGFDGEAAWNRVMTEVAQCRQASSGESDTPG